MEGSGEGVPAAVKRKSILLLNTSSKPDNLQVVHTNVPFCGPNDVTVSVKFCGLNFAECSMRQGLYRPMPATPFVPGYECSGEVEKVGENVSELKAGDRVVALNIFDMWHEKVVLPAVNVFKLPDNVTYEQAAAIPVNYVTASIMLFDMANLTEGQSVLVHMAAGGVGTAVGQLCRTVPNVTVFGTASAGKHDHCKEHGITHPIDYRTKDYVAEVKKISPRGVDIVLDPLAGNDSAKSHSLLKPLGKHIHYGAANVVSGSSRSIINTLVTLFRNVKYSISDFMSKSTMAGGVHVGILLADPENHHIGVQHMKRLIDLCSEGKIKPVIDKVFPFENVMDAMNVIYQRQNVGKILLSPEPAADPTVTGITNAEIQGAATPDP